MARNDKSVVGACSYLVIAREHCDRGDPVIIKSRISAWHNLLDCFAALAMTRMWHILVFSDHPAAARHPSIEGNLAQCFIFPTVGGGAIHDTVHFALPSLPMRYRTIVPVRIRGLILCRFHTLIISLGLCVTSLPHRFVLLLRFCATDVFFLPMYELSTSIIFLSPLVLLG